MKKTLQYDEYDVDAGCSIYDAAKGAIAECHKRGLKSIFFLFNGLRIDVFADSNATDIARIYSLMSEIRRLKAGY